MSFTLQLRNVCLWQPSFRDGLGHQAFWLEGKGCQCVEGHGVFLMASKPPVVPAVFYFVISPDLQAVR